MKSKVDVAVQNHGSIFTFLPKSERAEVWLREHTDGTWWGGALTVEHRYARDLAQAMMDSGFNVV